MKYYFILTDEKDAWMQFVYLPTGDYVSGYIRDLRSVGISCCHNLSSFSFIHSSRNRLHSSKVGFTQENSSPDKVSR